MNFFCIDLDEKQTQDFRALQQSSDEFIYVHGDVDLDELFLKHEGEHTIVASQLNTDFILRWESGLSLKYPLVKLEFVDGIDLSDELDLSSDGLDLSLDITDNDSLDLSSDFDNSQSESDNDAGLDFDLGLDSNDADELSLSTDELGISSELDENMGLDLNLSESDDTGDTSETDDDLSLDLGEDINNEDGGDDSLSLSLDSSDDVEELGELDESENLSENTEAFELKEEAALSLDNIDDSQIFEEMNDLTENDFSIDDIEKSLAEDEPLNFEVDNLDIPEEPATDEAEQPNVEVNESPENTDFSGRDMEGYSQTIRELREDRERLLSKVEELEMTKDLAKKEYLGTEAMLEEKKIELDIVKSRFKNDFEKLSRKLESLKSNESSVKDKNLELQEEIEKLNKKTFLDMRKVQVREKELSSQLSLLRTDTESQIRNRDIIIIDLKRKIDILEYDIEQSWKQEKAAKKEKLILQSKIDRLVGSLKDVVESLHEDDIDSWLNKIEKK